MSIKPILVFLLFVGLSNCSSDEPPSTTPDATTDVTDSGKTPDTGGEDTRAPDATVDVGVDATQDATQDVSDTSDVFMFPDVMSADCVHPNTNPNCPTNSFGPASFLRTVEAVEDTTCCRDFDGDGVFDNKVGEFVTTFGAVGADVNANIEAAIVAGRLSYLVEFSGLENAMFDPEVDIVMYEGRDTDIDFTNNLAGTGDFLTLDISYEPVGDAPKWGFQKAEVRNGKLYASDGVLQLRFPGLLDAVRLVVRDLELVADISTVNAPDLASGGRIWLENGELSGGMERDTFYLSLNEATTACNCLQREIFTKQMDDGSWTCTVSGAEQTACETDPQEGCRLLGSQLNCIFFESISDDVDVDLDGDGVNDAYSIGTKVSGIGAHIEGREP